MGLDRTALLLIRFIHNCLEFGISLCINFVDFKVAFDSIRGNSIWASMRHNGFPEKYDRIFQAFFKGDCECSQG